jgi:hypothetical protein
MATALQIVSAAAEKLGVKTAEIPLEADDFRVFLGELNDMLMEWSDLGITPRFLELTDRNDTVEIDRDAVGAVKANLAMRLAPTFGRVVSPALVASARDTKDRLLASVVTIGEVAYPDSLPMGSGNNCSQYDERLYPANKSENF